MDQQVSLEMRQSEVLVPYWTLYSVLENVEAEPQTKLDDDIGYLILLASTCTLSLVGEESVTDFSKAVIDRMLIPLRQGHRPARAAIFDHVVKWIRSDITTGGLRRPALELPNKRTIGKHLFRSVWDLAALCALGDTYVCLDEGVDAQFVIRQADELTERYCSDEADEDDLESFLNEFCPIGMSIMERLEALAGEAEDAVDESSGSAERYASAVGLYRSGAEMWNYAISRPTRPAPFTGPC